MQHPDGLPQLRLDLFAPASLRDPVADYRRLRDAGAVVRLARPDVCAIARYTDVDTALQAAGTLVSGAGVGFGAAPAPAGLLDVQQSDGESHARLRTEVIRPLSPLGLRALRVELKATVRRRVAALAGSGWFDAMAGLAGCLPEAVIADAVGIPAAGREQIADWAAAASSLVGPTVPAADRAALAQARRFLAALDTDNVRPGSWAGDLLAAGRDGRLSPAEALAAVSAYVLPGLQTTTLATGHLLHNLATHPAQWALLRADAARIPGAVLESVRRDTVVRWFARVAAAPYRVGGHELPVGTRVMLLFGSANRDERHYPDPDAFDITRVAHDHLAWGRGPHACAGMHLARIEMEVLLEALLEAGVTPVAGTPVPGTNSGLHGFSALPLRLDRA